MHSQRYDAYEAASDAIRFTPITIPFNTMRFDVMEKI